MQSSSGSTVCATRLRIASRRKSGRFRVATTKQEPARRRSGAATAAILAGKPPEPANHTSRPSNLRRDPMSTVARTGADGRDDFGEWHVYEPHKVGLPPLRPYFRALSQRRQFMWELARTSLRAQHFNTTLGQLWLILNPVMLGIVYFTLVFIIRGGGRGPIFLAHLMLCLFTFRLVSSSVSSGARSVVGGGRLLLNTAFPRLLLPLEAVLESVLRFLPTVIVFAVVAAIVGLPVGPQLLWVVPILVLMVVFGAGAAMFAGTAQVYFRDLT